MGECDSPDNAERKLSLFRVVRVLRILRGNFHRRFQDDSSVAAQAIAAFHPGLGEVRAATARGGWRIGRDLSSAGVIEIESGISGA